MAFTTYGEFNKALRQRLAQLKAINPHASSAWMTSSCASIGSASALGSSFQIPVSREIHAKPGDTLIIQTPQQAKKKKISRKESRKPFKAECRAQMLLMSMIGFEQWQAYRRTNRLLVRCQKDWIIGNVFGKYDKFYPLKNKPDVIRVDNPTKLYATSYCVITQEGSPAGSMPYTDKVISFAAHLLEDEKGFTKIANRLQEHKFKAIKECGIFNKIGDV